LPKTIRNVPGPNAHLAGVPADVEHGDVAGPGGGRIDDAAGAGVYAVGPDEQVSLRLGAVIETRHDPAFRCDLRI
jgi:hypothetical protein